MKGLTMILDSPTAGLAASGVALAVVLMMATSTAAHGAAPLAQDSDGSFERTSARLARGRYLANGPMHCFNCHAEAQGDGRIGNLPILGREGAGQVAGPNRFPNITSDRETGIGAWSDEQVLRAIREGVRPDGRILSTQMPWNSFSALTEEDARAVVVYIRSLPAIRKAIPPVEQTPALLVMRANTLAFEPVQRPTRPADLRTPVARGKYLATLAHCQFCHTPMDERATRLPGMNFGGGVGPNGVAANITQDPSGIPYYDEQVFIQTIRTGRVAGVRELKPQMLWRFFAQMTDGDLRDIFAYLKTLPPVQHRVNTTDPETPCPVCGRRHGMGDQNIPRATR